MPPRSESNELKGFSERRPLHYSIYAAPILQVVSRLRQSCGEMSEEDLGKLSVELLNCQSAAEARETFTCTQDMVNKIMYIRDHQHRFVPRLL